MKSLSITIIILIFLLPSTYSQVRIQKKPQRVITSKQTEPIEMDVPEVETRLSTLKFIPIEATINVPKVDVSVEPMENGDLVYHYMPGWTSGSNSLAQVSTLISVKNNEGKTITWEKVRYEYNIKGVNKWKEINFADKNIGNGSTKSFQNSRDYHEEGDVLYFYSGIPSKLTIKLYFKDYSLPVSMTYDLKPYNKNFDLPFKEKDLKDDELWEGGSTHGGGSQVFGLDLRVYKYKDDKWRQYISDGSSNSHYYIWGKPLYAMDDGVVVRFNNDVPNNPKPGEKADYSSYEGGGGGNHFVLKHGELVALYAHMIKGSLNNDLMQVGKTVKKGEFLGLAGNSGSSSGPHLHIHVRIDGEDNAGPFRPMIFSDGFVIGKSYYKKPMSNIKWSELKKQSIPGFEGTRSFIWPASKHPYCKYNPNSSEVSKHGVSTGSFQDVFNSIYTCGFYPTWMDGFNIGSKTYFNMSFRPSDGKPWVARHNLSGSAYQTEFNKWKSQGYRLTFVDSYIRNGQVNYTAVWRKDGGPAVAAYHGVSASYHQQKFNDWLKDGWVPTHVSSVYIAGKLYITAAYEKKNVGGMYHHFGMTMSAYQANVTKYHNSGYKLVYINAYNVGSSPRMNAIWYKNASFNSLAAKHGLSGAEYQSQFNNYTGNGYNTECVTGYYDKGVRYAGLWVK